MIKRKINGIFFLIWLGLVWVLSACGGLGIPTIEIPGDRPEIPEIAEVLPRCTGEFDPPVLVAPINGEIIDPDAPYLFEWEISCQPKTYNLKVFYYPRTTGPTITNENFETTAMQWDSSDPLDPITTYEWRLIADPWDSETYWVGSEWGIFTTGPVCDSDDLVAPNLIYPADGSVYTGKSWGNPFEVEADIVYPSETCIPEGYEIYISETRDFSTPNLNYFPPVPFYTSNPEGLLLVEDDSNDVPDCAQLYWRAWATVGETAGPISETFTFYTDIEGPCTLPFEVDPSFFVIASKDTNCRASDYTASKNLATLLMGEKAEILAINPHATHVLILEPNSEIKCWVWVELVDLLSGEEAITPEMLLELVVVQVAPTPAPTPTFTPEPTETAQPATPECSDGQDNDGDGGIDLQDPQCNGASDDDESK